jgi:hypothetical protein
MAVAPSLGNFTTLAGLIAAFPPGSVPPGSHAYAEDWGPVDSDGTDYHISISGVVIYAADYGIDPTGAMASDVAFNLAIQDAIHQKKKLIVPTGLFTLNAPLLLFGTTPTATRYDSLQMEGQGNTAPATDTLPTASGFQNNTIFYANFSNAPALIGNANRSLFLRNFGVVGQNFKTNPFPTAPVANAAAYVDTIASFTGTITGTSLAVSGVTGTLAVNQTIYGTVANPVLAGTYIVSGSGASWVVSRSQSVGPIAMTTGPRDSLYSPYAGICLDAFCKSTAPSDGGYPGLTSYYGWGSSGANGTHIALIENVFIQNFVVGIMNGPTGTPDNGDALTCRNVAVQNCRVACASGNNQADQWTITDSNIDEVQYMVDTLSYGGQNAPAASLINSQLGRCYGVLNCYALKQASVQNCYMEGPASLGRFGSGGGNDTPITFLNNGILLATPTTIAGLAQPPVILNATRAHFIGGIIGYGSSTDVFNFSGYETTFDGVTFYGGYTPNCFPLIGQKYLAGAGGGFARFDNCFVNPGSYGGAAGLLSDNFARSAQALSTFLGSAATGRLNATFQTNRVPDGANGQEYIFVPPANSPGGYAQAGVSALTLNSTTVTFTMTNAAYYLQPGDYIYWKMLPQNGLANTADVVALQIPIGGISGNNVTANMLFDPSFYDTVANQYASNQVFIAAHLWAPLVALTATTNTSTALTSVLPVNILTAGDWIIGYGANGADIPSPCRVVSTDGAGNVVLSRAATGSHAGVSVCFGQLQALYTTVRF